MYKVGDKFRSKYGNNVYMLCCLDDKTVCLVNLSHGYSYNGSIRVMDDRQITQDEFSIITNKDEFIKIDATFLATDCPSG